VSLPAPKVELSDLSAWRRLVLAVRRSVADPTRPIGELRRAERAAYAAVVLGTPITRDHPCVQLGRSVREFIEATVGQRRDLSERVLELAAEVEGRLTPSQPVEATEPADPARRPPRADIYG